MTDLDIQKVFSYLVKDKKLKKIYLNNFLNRFVYTTVDIEGNIDAEKRQKIINSLVQSFDYLEDYKDFKLSAIDIEKVGNIVNTVNDIENFRKIDVDPGEYAKWTPSEPREIRERLYGLLSSYYKIWCDRNVYEKEANFHIELMRIHSFEDGNKRISKLIMNYNLMNQNFPPVVITEDETELYYDYINNYDVEGFAKFLRKRSMQELNILMSLYKAKHKIPVQNDLIEKIIDDDELKHKRS